jgi:hypothetical protein
MPRKTTGDRPLLKPVNVGAAANRHRIKDAPG